VLHDESNPTIFGRVGVSDADKIIDDRRGIVSDEVRFRSSGLLLAHRDRCQCAASESAFTGIAEVDRRALSADGDAIAE
jgi:hypothetical protein